MKKTLRSLLLLALAVVMTIGLTGTALATEPVTQQIQKIVKDYVIGDNTGSAAQPAETFKFTVEAYHNWNVGGEAVTALPTIGDITFDPTKTGTEQLSGGAITLPTYTNVGDYWYKVTETDNGVAGVIYGTNDAVTEDLEKANGDHARVYYLHVQVVHGDSGALATTMTIHTAAPDATITDAGYNGATLSSKVSTIQNKYFAGDLEITKATTGNAGDKTKLFKVTVKFTNGTGKSIANGTITVDGSPFNEAGIAYNTSNPLKVTWSDNEATVDFYVKDATTVKFQNIPYGIQYEVSETLVAADGYKNKIEYTDSDAAAITFNGKECAADAVSENGGQLSTDAKSATGYIVSAKDALTITNDKTNNIDVGVVLSDAPYIALLLVAGAAALLLLRRRHSSVEE